MAPDAPSQSCCKSIKTGSRTRLNLQPKPAPDLQDITLEKLTPAERTDLISLMVKTVS